MARDDYDENEQDIYDEGYEDGMHQAFHGLADYLINLVKSLEYYDDDDDMSEGWG